MKRRKNMCVVDVAILFDGVPIIGGGCSSWDGEKDCLYFEPFKSGKKGCKYEEFGDAKCRNIYAKSDAAKRVIRKLERLVKP